MCLCLTTPDYCTSFIPQVPSSARPSPHWAQQLPQSGARQRDSVGPPSMGATLPPFSWLKANGVPLQLVAFSTYDSLFLNVSSLHFTIYKRSCWLENTVLRTYRQHRVFAWRILLLTWNNLCWTISLDTEILGNWAVVLYTTGFSFIYQEMYLKHLWTTPLPWFSSLKPFCNQT